MTTMGHNLDINATATLRRTSGFTLVELMVTLSVLAILITVAVPSFDSLMETQRAKSVSTDIYLALAKTRSEATKRNASVTLSPKNGTWSDGWQIINPSDGSVLEDHGATNGVAVTGPANVIYRSSGRIQGSTTSFAIASTGSAAVARCITVDSSGRPYAKASSC